MKLDPLSVMAKYSSLKGAGLTAFAAPPLAVLGIKKSCSVIAPEDASNAKTEMYPVALVDRERVAVMRYLGDVALAVAGGMEKRASSAQYDEVFVKAV